MTVKLLLKQSKGSNCQAVITYCRKLTKKKLKS